ncbi:hypothetical protein BD413DRAFT_215713 [Trametes elegans]|nr:hypothetical protein BD413DRAFT_215713 [Trametes elegans]
MPQLRSRKKARFSADPTTQNAPEEAILRKCHLARLPFELLAEVLSYMRSSRDVLALSRTSRHFREILVDNPATDFIWREARARCSTGPIPDPLPSLSEARYAAFLYNSGRCEICNKKTSRPYHSVSLRVRTCDTMKCQDTWRSHTRILSADEQEEHSDILRWIPRMELQDEAADPIVHVRLSDWNQALDEYREAKLLGPDALSEYLQKKQALADTMPERMEWYKKVTAWMTTLQKKRKLFTEIALTWQVKIYHMSRSSNESPLSTRSASDHALILGCTRYELLHLPTYSIAHHAKIRCEERWVPGEFEAVKGTVVAEMDALKARKQHRILESIKKGRRADVKSEYARMKSGEDPTKPLPSLPEFRSLPVVEAVEGSTTPRDPKLSNPFVASVLKGNLEQWLDNARTALAAVLGFPGWKTMSKRKLHPVDRLTARFRCKKCDAAGKDTGLDDSVLPVHNLSLRRPAPPKLMTKMASRQLHPESNI